MAHMAFPGDALGVLVTSTVAFVTLVVASVLHRLLLLAFRRVAARGSAVAPRHGGGPFVAWKFAPAGDAAARGQFEELEAAEELLASLPALRKNPSAYRRKFATSCRQPRLKDARAGRL